MVRLSFRRFSFCLLAAAAAAAAIGSACRDERLTFNQLAALEGRLVSARKIIVAYQRFLNQPNLDQQERERAELRISQLEAYTASGGVVVASKPLTPAEYEELKKSIDETIAKALELAAAGDNEHAEQEMEKASKLDPTSMRADFLLGLHAACVRHDYSAAEKYFNRCVERGRRSLPSFGPIQRANFVAALNNLALTKVRDNRTGEAFQLWSEAAEIQPRLPVDAARNLVLTGRYMQTVKQAKDALLTVTLVSLKKFSDRSKELEPLTEGTVEPAWIYLGYLDPTPRTPVAASAAATAPAGGARPGAPPIYYPPQSRASTRTGNWATNELAIGFGTAIVVAPGYLLTSRTIVHESPVTANRIRWRLGSQVGEEGRVVAVDAVRDLALIQDPAIAGEPLPLSATPLAEYQRVALVGCTPPSITDPGTFVFGPCTIEALPRLNPPSIAFDVTAFQGTDGSAVIDPNGNLVGLVAGGAGIDVPYADDVIGWESITAFLQQAIPNYTSQPNTTPLDSSNLEAALAGRIAAIECFIPPPAPYQVTGLSAEFNSIFAARLSDTACLACDGDGKVGCPNKYCGNGMVQVTDWEIQREPQSGATFRVEKKRNEACKVCGGRGSVNCTCSGGHDGVLGTLR